MIAIGLLLVVVCIVLLFPAVDRALERIDIQNDLGALEDDE